jgi:ApaG protein
MKRATWNPTAPVETHSETVTLGIRVRVDSFYVPDRSVPHQNSYAFGYRVRITNESASTTTLRSRHWIITDGVGLVQQVKGPGVVGEQPRLEPGEAFEYSSACPLGTAFGFMRGSYEMLRDEATFHARIGEFALMAPGLLN